MPMRLVVRCAVLMAAALVLAACAHSPDVREAMLADAAVHDPSFPDGEHQQLTQFAYIGAVTSADGPIRVVACHSVLTGMLAPRGESWIAFFDADNHFLKRMAFDFSAPPLRCEGARVIFFGEQALGDEHGDALDLAAGVHQWKLVEIPPSSEPPAR